MRIIAWDLSLTSSGYAVGVDGQIAAKGLVVGSGDGVPRMIRNRDKIMDKIEEYSPRLLLMEDVAFSMNKAYAKENAGMAYLLRAELVADRIPYIVIAATSIKKFVTGSGAAKKEHVLKDIFKRFGHDTDSNDVADAIGIAYIGMALVGDWSPTNKAQSEVVEQIRSKNGPILKPFSSPAEAKNPTGLFAGLALR